MSEVSKHVGKRIRLHRNIRSLTIQDLADKINKCKTTVSKYERGDIAIDVDTLVDIANALSVPVEQFIDLPAPHGSAESRVDRNGLFYKAEKMYMYFYDGRKNSINCSILEINNSCSEAKAILYLNVTSLHDYQTCKSLYSGKANYYDPFIRVSLFNQCNTMEQFLLYIINPLDMSTESLGLMCGISNRPLLPSATKCIVSLEPLKTCAELEAKLRFSKGELNNFKKLNLLIVDYDK